MQTLAILQIETTTACNAHCKFCPHDKLKETGTMGDDLFKKIIMEASQLPNLRKVIPMLNGEPFCDTKMLERVKFIRERLPWVIIELYTNGSLLTFEMMQELKKANAFVSISLNGLNPETRKAVMGLDDWMHVFRACKYAEQIKLNYRPTMVAYPEISQAEIEGFTKAGGTVIQYQSWAGQQYPYERKRFTQCIRALGYMTIRFNGDVCLCCFDPFGKVSFGNLSKETIEQVWKSEKHQEYVTKHKAGSGNALMLCDHCTEG